MFYWPVRLACLIFAKVYLRFSIRGFDNVPKKGAFIVASNHRSHLDPPILAASMQRKLTFLGKAELFELMFFGWFLSNLNCLRLDREGFERQALKKGLRVLRKGGALQIFPEGKRSRNGLLGKAKTGVAMFAFGSGAPVIPAFIRGTDKAMPAGTHTIRPSNVEIIYGKKIYPDTRLAKSEKKKAYQDFTDKVMQEISRLEEKEI
jgi:1-acyl-sn-glycerol-3-phosphate acyltransferase